MEHLRSYSVGLGQEHFDLVVEDGFGPADWVGKYFVSPGVDISRAWLDSLALL